MKTRVLKEVTFSQAIFTLVMTLIFQMCFKGFTSLISIMLGIVCGYVLGKTLLTQPDPILAITIETITYTRPAAIAPCATAG